MLMPIGNVFVVKEYLSFRCFRLAADQIDQCGLAGAVSSQQYAELAFAYGHAEIIDGLEATKRNADTVNF